MLECVVYRIIVHACLCVEQRSPILARHPTAGRIHLLLIVMMLFGACAYHVGNTGRRHSLLLVTPATAAAATRRRLRPRCNRASRRLKVNLRWRQLHTLLPQFYSPAVRRSHATMPIHFRPVQIQPVNQENNKPFQCDFVELCFHFSVHPVSTNHHHRRRSSSRKHD